MSPYNGDAATSVDGRTCGNNYFQSINGSVVPKGEPVIYFPVPLEGGFNNHTYTQVEKMRLKKRDNIILITRLGH